METLDRLTERLRRARSLQQRSVRRRQGRFLAEGPQAVREAVLHAAPAVREVYLTPDAARRYPEMAAAEVPVQLVAAEVLRAVSEDAQGVVAVVETGVLATSLTDLLAGAQLVAVLKEVSDPGNAGTVIRAADAAGADGVVFTAGSVELTNPKVVRSSAGSLFHLPVLTGVELGDAVGAARAAGVQVLAADGGGRLDLHELARAGGSPRRAVDLASPTLWVFGNEARGLASADLALADTSVRVPIYGKAESLNLATAVAVCVYASAAAQRS